MLTLDSILKRYVYLLDEGTFYDKKDRKKRDKAYISKKLIEIQDMDKAMQTLNLMISQGVNKAKIGSPGTISMVNDVYENSKHLSRLRRVLSKGENGLYSIAPNNEVTFMGVANVDKFVNLVAASGPFYATITENYQNTSDLNSKLDMMSVLKKIYERFLLDADVLLECEPQLISWSSDTPAYKILDPSILQPGPHPTWDQFTARLSHPEIFKAYLWSIFDPLNDGRQALWIRGEGMDGKSSVVNAISTFLGRDHVFSIGQDSIDQRWFFSSTYGKRLGVYMDCMNLQLLRKEKIKSILGGDTVEIDEKNEKIFSARIRSKLIVLSNYPAHINYNDKSELTRLLYITIKTFSDTKGDPNFEPQLVAEFPHFLYSCREIYPTLCPTGSQITVPQDMHDLIQRQCASLDADLVDEFIGTTLELRADTFITKMELKKELQKFFRDNQAANMATFSFENLLRKAKSMGVKEGRIFKSGVNYKAYIGIGLINSKNKLDLAKDVIYD